MKVQLDTDQKTIKIEESINLHEMIKIVKKILPNGEWKEFKVETGVNIVWGINPFFYNTAPYVYKGDPYPYPWSSNIATYSTNGLTAGGLFNIQS
jgi:hypothetical protein